MNPHPAPFPEDEFPDDDEDERTLVVQRHHLVHGEVSGLNAAHLFMAEPEVEVQPVTLGADALHFDRASGGVVSGDVPLTSTPPAPTLSWHARRAQKRRRAWLVAASTCSIALLLAAASALYVDVIVANAAPRVLPWLEAHGIVIAQRAR
jgi:hypothetical protein